MTDMIGTHDYVINPEKTSSSGTYKDTPIVTINYGWIKREILRRCFYLPQDIEDALDQMDKEQYD